MFVLYEMTRDIRIDPKDLSVDRVDALTDEINRRIANRVMLNIGLCISMWDIKSIGSGIIHPGDGGVTSTVIFRFVVFRPFQDEIIVGKIKNSTPEGVYVTLGFFDDIFIPKEGLQHPAKFNEREQIWSWEYKTGDDEEPHQMFMEKGDSIRFRVVSESYTDTIGGQQVITQSLEQMQLSSNIQPGTSTVSTSEEPSILQINKIPYKIVATINEPGLGLLSWWS